MTTVFKRQALIDAAKAAIESKQDEIDRWEHRAAAARQEHLSEWFANTRPELRAYRDRLSAALKSGKPVTTEQVGDVSRLLFSPLGDYRVAQKIGHPGQHTIKELKDTVAAYRGILGLLEASEGDTLSVAQVKTLGLTKLDALFRAAAQKGGVVEKSLV